jgi:hypothetical protein
MSNLKHIFSILGITLILTACQQTPHTVAYLMRHPVTLEKDLRFCMSDSSKSDLQANYCNIVLEAQEKIRDYLEAQQIDPEKFGQRIMDTEVAYTALKAEFIGTKRQFELLKTQNVSQAELQPLQDKLILTEKRYREKQQELKVLLAVIGLSSP